MIEKVAGINCADKGMDLNLAWETVDPVTVGWDLKPAKITEIESRGPYSLRKTLLYRFFKIGGIPKKLRPVLESEGILVCDEGIGGWVIMKDFRAPGKRFRHRIAGFSGFLVITHKRVIAYVFWKPVINVPVDDPRVFELKSELVGPDLIELSFESSAFDSKWQGRFVLSLSTLKAREFHSAINSLG